MTRAERLKAVLGHVHLRQAQGRLKPADAIELAVPVLRGAIELDDVELMKSAADVIWHAWCDIDADLRRRAA